LNKDENGYLLADSYNILNKWQNYFSQLLNVRRVSDVLRLEIHTAEPSSFVVEVAIAKQKKYKSPGTIKIPVKLIQAGSEMLSSDIHKLTNTI
jgi:hypothetical protein